MHNVSTSSHHCVVVFLGEIKAVSQACLHIAQNHLIGITLQKHHASVDNILTRRTPMNKFPSIVGKDFLKSLQQRHDRD